MLGVLMSAVVMACAPFESEDKSNEVPVTVYQAQPAEKPKEMIFSDFGIYFE